MNRRGFFRTLGAAIAGAAVAPLLRVDTAPRKIPAGLFNPIPDIHAQWAARTASVKARGIIADSMRHLGVLGTDEAVSPADFDYALRTMNRLIDDWRQSPIYTELELVHRLAGELAPHYAPWVRFEPRFHRDAFTFPNYPVMPRKPATFA